MRADEQQLRDGRAPLQALTPVCRVWCVGGWGVREQMALFMRQTALLEKLTEVYRVMSHHLPTYCKSIAVLR